MHRVNCTIPLMRGQVEVLSHEGSDKWSKTSAVAKMHLLPTPRVLIEISEPPTMMSGNVFNLDGLSTIRLPGGPEMQVRTVRVQIGHTNSSLLLPVRQPLTSIDAGAKLHSVRFDVINLAQLVNRKRHLVTAAPRQARSLAPGARPTRWNQLR